LSSWSSKLGSLFWYCYSEFGVARSVDSFFFLFWPIFVANLLVLILLLSVFEIGSFLFMFIPVRFTCLCLISNFNNMCLLLTLKQIALILLCFQAINAESHGQQLQGQSAERGSENIVSHSCIHDQIIEERKRPGRQVYSVTPQVYGQSGNSKPLNGKGRALLGISESSLQQKGAKKPIRIFLNYDAVGHSPDRDCRKVGDIVKVGVISDLVSSVRCTTFSCGSNIVCSLFLISLGSLQWLLFLALLAIPMAILQFMVIAGTIALLMIFPGRTKGIVFARLAIIKLIQDVYSVKHVLR